MAEQRRVGRPSTAVLSSERIVEAAFGLVRARGARGFTMTALAEDLGVRPSAIYHHVPGRDALIGRMRRRVSASIDRTPFEHEPIVDAFVAWGRSYRAAFASTPESIVLLATLPIDADLESFDEYELITRRLVSEGWPIERTLDTIVAIESFILGSALDALAPAGNMRPGAYADAVPTFARAEMARDAAGGDSAARTFEIGLRALVAGLREWALG
ncbi:TetR/AcrR family transcriptional regulator C-terminal domain-containing protein [Agrococcus versicolor]|uniref:TetR/AcrR family transcriptional regulator C-terminal domain-containing protein n=2 Tax=Agrococcus versicolor TaxID=501482 RepID=A0ABN3AJ04_9MICO